MYTVAKTMTPAENEMLDQMSEAKLVVEHWVKVLRKVGTRTTPLLKRMKVAGDETADTLERLADLDKPAVPEEMTETLLALWRTAMLVPMGRQGIEPGMARECYTMIASVTPAMQTVAIARRWLASDDIEHDEWGVVMWAVACVHEMACRELD